MAADTISRTKGTSGRAAPCGAAASAQGRVATPAGQRRPSDLNPMRALCAVLSVSLSLLIVPFGSKPAASQEAAAGAVDSVGLRPDDVERAIWLLDDLSLFFGSLSEQERNQFARENWITAQGNYETVSGRLAERFGRGQIRIADLDAGQQVVVQDKVITLDRDLDGAWPTDRITGLRERGQDDWIPVSGLSAVLLRALAPTFDRDKWSWFQDHLRRTPAIARLPGEPDADAVAAVTGFGFLRDRYLPSTILAETAPRTALRRRWAERRDGLDREAEAFFQRQSGGEQKPTAANLGRQWAEFTKSSLQLSKSWADKRTEPAVPSFGRVSDSDLPLLVQRAARPANPLDRYALVLPVSPLEPVTTESGSNQAEAQGPAQDTTQNAAGGDADSADAAPAEVTPAGATARPEIADNRGQDAGTAESSDRSPAADPVPEAGPMEREEPEAAARFPLPQLSGLEEKLEQAEPTFPAAAETTVAIPDPPAAQAPEVQVEVLPGAAEGPASTADAATADVPPAEVSAAPTGDASVPAETRETAQAASVEATEAVVAAQEAGGQSAVQNDPARQPGNEQAARLSDRDTTPQASHLSVWIEGIGAEGLATIGLAILSFFALSLLMALWLRALFRSERTQEGGEQPIIVVVETERGRPVGSAYATAGAVPNGGTGSRTEFIPAPPEETHTYAPPPANDPDAWPTTAAAKVDGPAPPHPPPAPDGETARQPRAAVSPPESSAEPAPEPDAVPTAPESSESEGSDPTEAKTADDETVRTAADCSLAGAASSDEREEGSRQLGLEPSDPAEVWPAAPFAPTKPLEPTSAEVRREEETGARPASQPEQALDADDPSMADAGEARSAGSAPPRPNPDSRPETGGETGSDREPAAPHVIVEPNQIEEALVALRDGQDIAARELDPDRTPQPQPFATMVPPVTLGAEAQPTDHAAMAPKTDPFDPGLGTELPAAAAVDGEPAQDRSEPPEPTDASDSLHEDVVASEAPKVESKDEDIADRMIGANMSPAAEPADVADAETTAASDEPEALGEGPLPAITAPQADSLFKEIGNALRAGDMTAFHSKFGDLTLLPPDRVERILYSPGGEDFAVTCRALGVDKLDFASLFLLVRKQCLGEERVAPHRFSRVLALYDEVETDAAEQVLDRWRTDPNYPGIRDRVQDGPSPLNG